MFSCINFISMAVPTSKYKGFSEIGQNPNGATCAREVSSFIMTLLQCQTQSSNLIAGSVEIPQHNTIAIIIII